jgi:hypothetical protein
VGLRARCDGDATDATVQPSTMARMRRVDVAPGVEDMRTVDSSDITKSVQEPKNDADPGSCDVGWHDHVEFQVMPSNSLRPLLKPSG